jgi:NAD(P)-dependent dehydrogenase (short-subunit alcohol dehydrogenase family)
MLKDLQGKTAVLTGAGSGFGLECVRIGARAGMKLVLVDVQADALSARRPRRRRWGRPMCWRGAWTCPAARPWRRWPRR